MSAPNLDLSPREAAARLVDAHSPEWLDTFAEALERRRGGRQLERVLRVWRLSQAEAGRLFGVSRQAVAKWLRDGVPVDRTTQIAELSAATDLLVRYVKRDRIPAVVRREAAALDGHALLDVVAAGDTGRALEACRQMFTFGDAHT